MICTKNKKILRASHWFEVYIVQWTKLLQICEKHIEYIDLVIFQSALNIHLKSMAEVFYKYWNQYADEVWKKMVVDSSEAEDGKNCLKEDTLYL